MSTDADIITRWGYLPSRDADAPTKAMALFTLLALSEQRNITPPSNPRALQLTPFVITDKIEATINGQHKSLSSEQIIDAFKCLHRFYTTKVITQDLRVNWDTQIFEFFLINWLLYGEFKPENLLNDTGNVDENLFDEFMFDNSQTYYDWMVPLAKALEIMINLKLARHELRSDLLYERMRIWLPELRSIAHVKLHQFVMIKRSNEVKIVPLPELQIAGQSLTDSNLTVQQILGPFFDEFSVQQRLSLRGFDREFDPNTQRATSRAPLPAQAMESIREFLGVARWRAR